jgi:thioredoxin 1
MKAIGKRLQDGEVGPFLRTRPPSAIVEVSTSWCVPCRMLDPIVHKLAFEFEIPLIKVDGDVAPLLKKKHKMVFFPTLLFFQSGKLVDRHTGFLEPKQMRRIILRVFKCSIQAGHTKAELAFLKAYRQADRRMTEIVNPPSKALESKLAVINPELTSIDKSLKRKVRAGRISSREAARRLTLERERLYAPFQAEMEALRTAWAQACETYEAIMNAAVEAFTRQHARTPDPSHSAKICLPGDASCRIN